MLVTQKTAVVMSERTILRISGSDARKFLQNLVSNDVKKLDHGMVYTALLTPQGKYLVDFFLVPDGNDILVDVATQQAGDLTKRLTMYKLRADVAIAATDITVSCGWRYYGAPIETTQQIDWDAQRVALGIPEFGAELTSESYILEMGFARLNGVDFRKGCYVGQEVTARMKHKTELRKGLARVTFQGPVTCGQTLLSQGKAVGTVHTVSGQQALCYVRFDRIEGLGTVTAQAHQIDPLI